MGIYFNKSAAFRIIICFMILIEVIPSYSLNNGPEKDFNDNKVEKITASVCIFSGMLTGGAHIFWSAVKDVDTGTPLYLDVFSAFPSLAAGSYAGYMVSGWLSEKMLDSSNDAFLLFMIKGIYYSSLSGAAILTSSILPLFITSYYTGSIDFNFDSGSGLAGPVIASFAGGAGYGMVFGALFGSLYSFCIYMIIN